MDHTVPVGLFLFRSISKYKIKMSEILSKEESAVSSQQSERIAIYMSPDLYRRFRAMVEERHSKMSTFIVGALIEPFVEGKILLPND